MPECTVPGIVYRRHWKQILEASAPSHLRFAGPREAAGECAPQDDLLRERFLSANGDAPTILATIG